MPKRIREAANSVDRAADEAWALVRGARVLLDNPEALGAYLFKVIRGAIKAAAREAIEPSGVNDD